MVVANNQNPNIACCDSKAKENCMLRILALLIGHLGILPITAYYMTGHMFLEVLGGVNYDITNYMGYFINAFVLLSTINVLSKPASHIPVYMGFLLVMISTTLLMLVANVLNGEKSILVITIYTAIILMSIFYTPTVSMVNKMLAEVNPSIVVWYFTGQASVNSTASFLKYITSRYFEKSSIYPLYVLSFMTIICHFTAIPLVFKLEAIAKSKGMGKKDMNPAVKKKSFKENFTNLGVLYRMNYKASLILISAFIVLFISFPSLAIYTTQGDPRGPFLFTFFGLFDFLIKIPISFLTEKMSIRSHLIVSLISFLFEILFAGFNVLLFLEKSHYLKFLNVHGKSMITTIALYTYPASSIFYAITSNVAISLMYKYVDFGKLQMYNSIAIPLNVSIGIVIGMTFSSSMRYFVEYYAK